MPLTKVTPNNLHTTVQTMVTTMVNENAVDSADVNTLFDTRLATKTTSNIAEGSNLYYTDARADARVSLIVDAAPSTLNTLNELAAALGDDANFSTTVTNSIATKLPLAGGTVTGDINFGDDDKAIFGAGSDLQIYHDGGGSFIDDVGTGNLLLKTNGNKVAFQNDNSGSPYDMLKALTSGAVQLNYLSDLKLATTSTGVDVTGTLTATDLILDGGTGSSVFLQDGTATNGYQLRANVSSSVDGGLLIEDLSGKNIARFDQNNDISFYEDTGTTAKFFWDASTEKLGIGTSSPFDALHVEGTIRANVGDANDENIRLTTDGGGGFVVDVSDATVANPTWSIRTFSNEPLAFDIGGAERMRITSSGNVGIGVTQPATPLQIYQSTNATAGDQKPTPVLTLSAHTNSDNEGPAIEFNSAWVNNSSYLATTINNGWGVAKIAGVYDDDQGNGGALSFYTNEGPSATSGATSSQLTEKMRIKPNGNVGIGTSSPSAKLHVSSVTATNLSSSGSPSGGSINTSNGDIVTGRIFFTGNSGSGTNTFGINNEAGKLVLYNYSTSRYLASFSNGQHITFGQNSHTDMYNGTGSNGFAVVNAGNGSQYVPIQNTADSNIYLSKHSSYTDSRVLQFAIGGSTKGSVTVSSSGTTYNTTSDLRLKTDIKPIENAADKLLSMNPVEHKWKADPKDDAVHGFIAQEMKEIIPEAVYGEPDGDEMMSMDYGRITPVIVAALQDALNEIKELKTRINVLENK